MSSGFSIGWVALALDGQQPQDKCRIVEMEDATLDK